jgi:hypothetical protein
MGHLMHCIVPLYSTGTVSAALLGSYLAKITDAAVPVPSTPELLICLTLVCY